MRQDYEQFIARGTEILSIGPENRDAFRRYWEDHDIPFVGLADPDHFVAGLYGQQVKLLKFGRMPALYVVDRSGKIRYTHHAKSMRDIPNNTEVLSVIDRIIDEERTLAQASGLCGDSPIHRRVY